MGLAGSLIGIAFFFIVIIFAITFFSTFFTNVFAFIEEFFELQANKSVNRVGSTVCDLKFQLWGAFDEAGFGFALETDQRLYLGVSTPNSGGNIFHPEIAKVTFQDCYTKTSGFQIQSIAPKFNTENLSVLQQELAFTNITDLTFTITFDIIRVDDNTSIGTKTVTVFEKSLADLPHTFSSGVKTFSNVELSRYNVEITCGGDCTKINDLSGGEAFIFKIRLG